jgi:hypothetical protein
MPETELKVILKAKDLAEHTLQEVIRYGK